MAQDALFVSNALHHQNRAALKTIILQRFAQLTSEQATDLLDLAKIANARVNTLKDDWQHPQLAVRERWQKVDSPVGPLPSLKPPGQQSSFEYTCGAIPELGQHTQEILKEFGF